MVDKKKAAEVLNVSTRLVERYASEGRLGEVRYVRGRTGKQADYDESAIERLKAELEAPDHPATALQAPNRSATGLVAAEYGARLINALDALSHERARARPSVAIEAKPLLKLSEAQALTGLSRGVLLEAIDSGKLKARIIGRAWRVKRADLENYIKKL
jgi:excisionase family DNA binding protein